MVRQKKMTTTNKKKRQKVHYRIDLAQAAACCSQAVIFGGLAEGASPGPDTFPGLHPNALQAASRQLFA